MALHAPRPPRRRAEKHRAHRISPFAAARYRLARTTRSEKAARHLRGVRAGLWRQRYLLAALWVVALAWWVIGALAPPPPGHPILVADRDIPAGEPLTAELVRTAHLPAAAIPKDAIRAPGDLPTGPARIPLSAGMPLAASLFSSTTLQDQLPAGFVAMPVLLEAGALAITETGQWVSLYAAGETGSALVANRALILQLHHPEQSALDLTGAERYIDAVVAIDQRRATVLLDALAIAPLRAVLPAR